MFQVKVCHFIPLSQSTLTEITNSIRRNDSYRIVPDTTNTGHTVFTTRMVIDGFSLNVTGRINRRGFVQHTVKLPLPSDVIPALSNGIETFIPPIIEDVVNKLLHLLTP